MKEGEAASLAAFKALLAQKTEIEAAFGSSLDWQDLPGKLGCRICKDFDGGWKTPESEWGNLQDKMIDGLVRLDKTLRSPIQALN